MLDFSDHLIFAFTTQNYSNQYHNNQWFLKDTPHAMHSIIQQIKDFATSLCCFELFMEISILNVRFFFFVGWSSLLCNIAMWVLHFRYIFFYVLFFIQLWWEGGGIVVVALTQVKVPYDWEAVTTSKETMKILLDNNREQDVSWPLSLWSLYDQHIYVLVSFFYIFPAQQMHKKHWGHTKTPRCIKVYSYFRLSSI